MCHVTRIQGTVSLHTQISFKTCTRQALTHVWPHIIATYLTICLQVHTLAHPPISAHMCDPHLLQDVSVLLKASDERLPQVFLKAQGPICHYSAGYPLPSVSMRVRKEKYNVNKILPEGITHCYVALGPSCLSLITLSS